jgi:hypothetical protein
MRHFKLCIRSGSSSDELNEVLNLHRQFQEVEIEIPEENCEQLEKIAAVKGTRVAKLVIHTTHYGKDDSVLKILKGFPLVREVHVNSEKLWSLIGVESSGNRGSSEKISLPFLKQIHFLNTCHDILGNIEAPHLESMELTSTSNIMMKLGGFLMTCPELKSLIFKNDLNYLPLFEHRGNWPFNLKVLEVSNDGNAPMDGLENILQKFSDLEVLTVSCGMISDVMFPEPQDVPFRLTKLSFSLWSPYIGSVINDNYCAFLETQKESLKEIESISLFRETVELDSEFLVLFTRMKNLQKLTFDVKNPFPKAESFYENLEPMPKVTELRFTNISKRHIRLVPRNENFLKMMLSLFPNLEVFEDCDFTPNSSLPVSFIALHNPKLKVLSINNLKTYSSETKFQLKELKFKTF